MIKAVPYKVLVIVLCLLFFGVGIIQAQVDSATDSLPTPFRKGRWLSGLSGSISSSTNVIRSNDDRSSTNRISLSINGGNFFEERWLVGGIIVFGSTEFDSETDISTETFFVGPLVSHYFSDSPRGSLFLSLAPGFSRYRDAISIDNAMSEVDQKSVGSGFAINVGLGYSYVIQDRIAFDIGFDINQAWFSIDVEDIAQGTSFSDNVAINNISFSFGFRILLNKLLQ